jgi:DNA-binding MarR family transcriptional regulator
MNQVPELDKTIHERSRLLILSHLASNRKREISFNELQEQLGFTSGNLSAQLKKLNQAGYVRIHKTFRDNKPHTSVALTPKGSKALDRYLDEMDELVKTLRKN